MKLFTVKLPNLSQFSHRLFVFAAPFVAAGGYTVVTDIRDGSLNAADPQSVVLAFVAGALIAVVNYLRSKTAPTPPAPAPTAPDSPTPPKAAA